MGTDSNPKVIEPRHVAVAIAQKPPNLMLIP